MTIHVLVVDDSKLARIVIARTIAALQPDWVRVEASSAEEALNVFEREEIDVLIVDFNMPGRNGLDFAEELRRRGRDLPIALVTANIQEDIIARARAASVAFVAKPISEDSLRGFISGVALKLRRTP